MTASDSVVDGVWENNPVLAPLLGLCPALAVTDSVVKALGLGIATTLVLVLSTTTVSLTRNLVRSEVRILVSVLIIACYVTSIELVLSALFYELRQSLGIFVPLIVANCMILGHAEAFATRHGPSSAALDGLGVGLGFIAALVSLAAVRELIGNATLFSDAQHLLGQAGGLVSIELIEGSGGFLLAVLPPGAFIGLGLLLALKNAIGAHRGNSVGKASVSP